MKTKHLFLLLTCFAFSSGALSAKSPKKAEAPVTEDVVEVYNIDPSHSSANFSVKHFLTPVRGSITGVTGHVNLDRLSPKNSSVEAKIDMTTFDTANAKRDGHMKSKEFLNVEQFPVLLFKSSSFEPKRTSKHFRKGVQSLPKEWILSGNLTFLGKTKAITIVTEFLGEGPGMKGTYLASWRGTVQLSRKDWGLSFGPMNLAIGDTVDVELIIESVRPSEP